jgi:hypothetical protein
MSLKNEFGRICGKTYLEKAGYLTNTGTYCWEKRQSLNYRFQSRCKDWIQKVLMYYKVYILTLDIYKTRDVVLWPQLNIQKDLYEFKCIMLCSVELRI